MWGDQKKDFSHGKRTFLPLILLRIYNYNLYIHITKTIKLENIKKKIFSRFNGFMNILNPILAKRLKTTFHVMILQMFSTFSDTFGGG